MAAACGSGNESLSFELKYCERCGGLWLRPTGGEQIYCRACGRAMEELPPSSHLAEIEGFQEEALQEDPDIRLESNDDEDRDDKGADAMGGVA
jgi:hypothetical protein